MKADGLPPAIKAFRRVPYFRGMVCASETEAEREAATQRKNGRKTVIYPFNGTFAVYYSR